MNRAEIDERSRAVDAALKSHLSDGGRLCIVKAPPGSGKTHLLLQAMHHAISIGNRVAIAAQTNAQADDICARVLADDHGVDLVRFAAKGAKAPDHLAGRLTWTDDKSALPATPCVVVTTTAKWSLVKGLDPFDVLFVDEAWQMAWADFMLLGKVAGRFVLIGDPGQIAPVVSIPVHRWETSPSAPHLPAPDVILSDPTLDALELDLPACRRLPADSVDLVRPFYDFEFAAWAQPGERWLRPTKNGSHSRVDPVLEHLELASTAICTIPTPGEGPPLEEDLDIAGLVADLAARALERVSEVAYDDTCEPMRLRADQIGITATHRVLNAAIVRQLPAAFRDQDGGIRVDTPERWQGLERPFMIVVHPLSGVVYPSAFDLETGRLCVMASRHRSAMVVVSRDHVPETLDTHIPAAEQAVGRPDVSGRGHAQNTDFWQRVADAGGVLPVEP